MDLDSLKKELEKLRDTKAHPNPNGGLYWQPPVQTYAHLPTDAVEGQTHFVEDEDSAYIFTDEDWYLIAGGTK